MRKKTYWRPRPGELLGGLPVSDRANTNEVRKAPYVSTLDVLAYSKPKRFLLNTMMQNQPQGRIEKTHSKYLIQWWITYSFPKCSCSHKTFHFLSTFNFINIRVWSSCWCFHKSIPSLSMSFLFQIYSSFFYIHHCVFIIITKNHCPSCIWFVLLGSVTFIIPSLMVASSSEPSNFHYNSFCSHSLLKKYIYIFVAKIQVQVFL